MNRNRNLPYAKISAEKWVAIIAFFSHFCFNFVLKHVSALPTDAASKSVAAYLAGYDWTSVMTQTNYYGTGFYILLTPVYILTNNESVIYYVTLFFLALIISGQAVLCYKIQRKFLKVENIKIAIAISLITSFLSVIPSNVSINEPPLEFIMWVILYLFLQCVWEDNKKKSFIYTMVIGGLLLWSRTIHERAVVFICSFIIAFIFIFFIINKKIVLMVPLTISAGIMGAAAWIYVRWVKEYIWLGTVEGRNTIGHEIEKASNSIVNLLFTKDGFASFVHIIVSQITTATIYSGGLFMIALIGLLYELFRIVKHYFVNKEIADSNIAKLSIILLFGISAIATIILMGISCLVGVNNAEQLGTGSRVYCFLRYFYIFVPPLIMLTLCDLCNGSFKYILIGISALVSLLFFKTFVKILGTVISIKEDSEMDRFHYLSPLSGRRAKELLTMHHVYVCALCLAACFIIIYLLYKRQKYWTLIIVYGILTIYIFGYMNLNFWKNASDTYYSLIDSTKTFVYGDMGINQEITKIYSEEINRCYMLLSEMPKYSVLCEIPTELGKGEILIVSTLKKAEQCKYKYYFQLDENEYIMFSDEDLYNIFLYAEDMEIKEK